jgi:hypothetical protein
LPRSSKTIRLCVSSVRSPSASRCQLRPRSRDRQMASISIVAHNVSRSIGSNWIEVTRGVLMNSHSDAFPSGALNHDCPASSEMKIAAGRVPATMKSASCGAGLSAEYASRPWVMEHSSSVLRPGPSDRRRDPFPIELRRPGRHGSTRTSTGIRYRYRRYWCLPGSRFPRYRMKIRPNGRSRRRKRLYPWSCPNSSRQFYPKRGCKRKGPGDRGLIN